MRPARSLTRQVMVGSCLVLAFQLGAQAPTVQRRPATGPRAVGRTSPEDAERMAAEALEKVAADPGGALSQAREALAATVDFEPTAFVRAGRKGEVVEDDYLAARDAYRKHRARLHAAVGRIYAERGDHGTAVRYLRRAELLGPERAAAIQLAASFAALGRAAEAQVVLAGLVGVGGSGPDLVAVLEKVVDMAGWPSAQVEIDRARTLALPGLRVEWRDGPFDLPKETRLSTAPVFKLADAPVNLIYAAEASCRSCSEDVEALRKAVPPSVRTLVLPEGQDSDHALRQVLGLFKVSWPVLIGPGVARVLGAPPRSVVIVGRGGWGAALMPGAPRPELSKVIDVFGRADVSEPMPRPGWNRRRVERGAPAPLPGLRPEGLAPGDDEPVPAEFEAAVSAYREKRPAEAMKLFAALAERQDGWLLPAEARFDRALCLHALGRREEARKLLLRTGDSRFQDAVDRALEAAGSARRP